MKALILITAVLATVAAAPAFAQTESYETPKYMPQQPTVLDPNFGLPSFGMPGAGLPQQRTQAPDPNAPADKPEIFKTDPPDFTSQTKRLLKPGYTTGYASMDTTPLTTSETPLFTTNEGGTTGNDTTTGDDTN